MIPKVVANRRDGKSSFRQLAAYVTHGITQSGESPAKHSWSNLTQYITKDSVLDALGEHVEKTIGVETGNVSSLENAPAEMYAVAQQAPRVKEPVYHYILSWPEHERPATQDIFAAARDTLAALGMGDHQYIIAIHANTDNLHAHIEVNRVHPKTFRAFDPYRDYLTLHRTAREVEIRYGWHHDNGAFQVVAVNGQKHIVRNDDYVDPDLAPSRAGAQRAEVWSGEQSLETWCKGEPATDLRRVLKDARTAGWQDVHRVLALHGLELREAGGRGMQVVDVSHETPEKGGRPLAIRASAAFRFLKRNELEERFGAFEARSPELEVEPQRTYQRDPHKRLESRLARRALRDALHARFQVEEKAARDLQAIARQELIPYQAEERDRYAALREHHAQTRAVIREDRSLTPALRQALYMGVKMTMMRAREQLVEQLRQERSERRELLPPIPTWREWVEQQAQLGDEAAISALRGMVYQDGRDQKKKAARDAIDAETNAIMPAQPQDSDPHARRFGDLVWQVAKNGRVTYRFASGEDAFNDDGERVTFGRQQVSDDALALSLQYSAQKWQGGLRISGGDFAFKARVVRIAVEQGIAIQNIELRDLEQQIRAEREGHQLVKSTARTAEDAVPPPLPSTGIDEPHIEEIVRGLDPYARFSDADTRDGRYRGPVVAVNSRFVAQSAGKHSYVLHERSAFDNPPDRGQPVTIQYQSGKAVVQTLKTRPAGRGSR